MHRSRSIATTDFALPLAISQISFSVHDCVMMSLERNCAFDEFVKLFRCLLYGRCTRLFSSSNGCVMEIVVRA